MNSRPHVLYTGSALACARFLLGLVYKLGAAKINPDARIAIVLLPKNSKLGA